ncbi:unnamed protein product [Mycena citricolor]|uniref:C2H2-type domain-containing protein n=1 Tax=Mycena citricolor TaxID=2018698 RepID=A0AAD2Q279_9AGAR|nr:unnamed protein product [Mycena citricolor]
MSAARSASPKMPVLPGIQEMFPEHQFGVDVGRYSHPHPRSHPQTLLPHSHSTCACQSSTCPCAYPHATLGQGGCDGHHQHHHFAPPQPHPFAPTCKPTRGSGTSPLLLPPPAPLQLHENLLRTSEPQPTDHGDTSHHRAAPMSPPITDNQNSKMRTRFIFSPLSSAPAKRARADSASGSSAYLQRLATRRRGRQLEEDEFEVEGEAEVDEGVEDELEMRSRKHVCDICGKRFNRPSSLRIHVNTHTGEMPFTCPYPRCGRAFNVNSNMRRHYRNHSASEPTTSPRPSPYQIPYLESQQANPRPLALAPDPHRSPTPPGSTWSGSSASSPETPLTPLDHGSGNAAKIALGRTALWPDSEASELGVGRYSESDVRSMPR